METLVFLLFLFALFVDVNSAPPTAGPFDVFLTDLVHCPETSKGIQFEHKVQKLSRKKLVITANVTIDVPLNDELGINVNLAKQTSQGWKENFIILDVPKACSVMKLYVPALERDLAQQMKLKSGHCPYPVGNYSVTVPLQVNVGVFPVFPYGKYLSKVNVMKNNKRIFCIHGFIDIVPKKSG